MDILRLVLLAALLLPPAAAAGGVVVTVVSQANSRHSRAAQQKRQQWIQELNPLGNDHVVLLSHELVLTGAAWTLVPLFKPLSVKYKAASWFVFMGEETDVNWARFMSTLDQHNSEEELFLGHSLQDEAATIIHHYLNPHSLSYPSLPAGFVLSRPAIHKAAKYQDSFSPNFNIDVQYELALFLKYLKSPELRDLIPDPPPAAEGGITLTDTPELCINRHSTSCATTFFQDLPNCEPTGGDGLSDGVFFAVKTCQKYHETRLPVVMETWAKDVPDGSLRYFSEVADSRYPTVDVGVANTETGHCGKMFAIIKQFVSDESLQHYSWLVIADDDTLLSVSRMQRLLLCYDPAQSILLGEVYGYLAHQSRGLSYVTGGGGMVLSRAAATSLMGSKYRCPSIDYPDDMFLGSVAGQLNWDLVHSPLFHQSQPESFPDSILEQQTAVSFHRHRPRDPLLVYQQYLADREQQKHRYPKSEL